MNRVLSFEKKVNIYISSRNHIKKVACQYGIIQVKKTGTKPAATSHYVGTSHGNILEYTSRECAGHTDHIW
jgi:hypothetical protein